MKGRRRKRNAGTVSEHTFRSEAGVGSEVDGVHPGDVAEWYLKDWLLEISPLRVFSAKPRADKSEVRQGRSDTLPKGAKRLGENFFFGGGVSVL